MRRLSTLALSILLVGASTAYAAPIPISNTFQWGTGSATDQTFSDSSLPQWSHTLIFGPTGAQSITDVTLELRHKGNGSFSGEVWVLGTQGGAQLASLSGSWLILDFYVTQTFALPASLLPTLPTDSWTLALKLFETTGGNDSITLDYATLSAKYDPAPAATPEPASLTLLGSGIAAALWRRRRQKRQNAQ